MIQIINIILAIRSHIEVQQIIPFQFSPVLFIKEVNFSRLEVCAKFVIEKRQVFIVSEHPLKK